MWQQSGCRHNCNARLVVALLFLAAASAGKQTAGTGYIAPPTQVPDFNPSVWNQAYKLTLRNIPAEVSSTELLRSLRFPHTMLRNIQLPQDCSKRGFDSTLAKDVSLGSCFTRQNSGGTVDYWIKLPGLALVNGNCYCYGLDMFQGGYCYPGTRGGAMISYRQRMTCTALTAGLISDGAEAVSRQQVLSGQPSSGHYIALLARPESCIKGHCYEADFHVMRKDSSGTWSWKHPGMPATNRDLFGVRVSDPEAAALLGSYQVCGYFRVEPQKMRHVDAGSLKEQGPLPANPALSKYRAMPGVQVEITPLPYNPATDTAISTASQAAVDEDTAWERLKGSEQYMAWRVREKQALELLPRGYRVSELASATSSSDSSSSSSGKRGTRARRQLLQFASKP